MASLKDLRNRIGSVKATQKITKAMQMVAAAKLRKAQANAELARPYAEKMQNVISNIARSIDKNDSNAPKLLVGNGSDKIHLLVVATAERGLCGGFNSSIARLARDKARELKQQGLEVKILCIGKKGADVLKSEFANIMLPTIDLRNVKNIVYENAEEIAKTVLDNFDKNEFNIATLFYAKFQSIITQIPTAQKIIPAEITQENENETASHFYEYEPDETSILQDLLPRNIATQIFRALLENAASEQGARMSAMDNATRNAGEMIDKLTLTFNRQRQAQITKELIEIISGAEAL